jgi:hypothetical protein
VQTDPRNLEKREAPLSKVGYLAGLPQSVRRRIEVAYSSGSLGTGIQIHRDTRPDRSRRQGEYPDWIYRLLEASFAVEDELEHAGPERYREVVTELRRRRNRWLDLIGENERAA